MVTQRPTHLVQDFLGSAQIFTSAVHDLLEAQLREVTGKKLTFAQLKLLKMVSLTEAYTVGNVAAFLGVSNAAASRAVDRLVRRRLLHRAEAATDRRAVRLSLTEKGRRLLESYETASERSLEELFRHFSPEQLRTTADLLDNLSLTIVDRGACYGEMCFRCGIHFRDRCLLRQSAGRDCHFHLLKKEAPKERRPAARASENRDDAD
ncbi:MAG: winged helix DNA-binding protein [Gemmatimonadales bacterium]|nr:winged helix DNA-binding protein [Gemmatimonadales bacterium]